MPPLLSAPPHSAIEPVTDVLHGVPVTDPYRWLEDQNSPRTRAWIDEQTRYARAYLDSIPGRDRIRERIREFLAVETYDSMQKVGNRYFFRKRLPDQEQPCIYMREGPDGEDQLLVDPFQRANDKYTSVKPLRISADGGLLLYEVKQGGERTGTFELLELDTRKRLPDLLPRGYLRGFAFAPDRKSFYYVHEAVDVKLPFHRAAYHHVLGTRFDQDQVIFRAGRDAKLRLGLLSDNRRIAFLVYHFSEKTITDIYLKPFDDAALPRLIFHGIDCMFGLCLLDEKILAITNIDAPNRRIVEIGLRDNGEQIWKDIVPERQTPISNLRVAGDRLFVSYATRMNHRICVFDLAGERVGEIPIRSDETIRMVGGASDGSEVFLERESFVEPINIHRYSANSNTQTLWASRNSPFDSSNYGHIQVTYASSDGTRIPMYIVGRRDVLERMDNPAIMTSYGGYGTSMTPQFSTFVAFLMERGCLFALPNIRGGSEFGVEWHNAAKRRNRQVAFNDFLCAAEWLIQTGRTSPRKLAIFGGSNSGLLVGAALTQRPDLFRAVVCMVPMVDMLRYHLFDNAHVWREEFGTAEDPDDFRVLAKYSPYHKAQDGAFYPAVMIVSGDADQNCNSLHARKMAARLQAANASEYPIFLDYSKLRGHSPVLPLSTRVEALTDRMAFLCDQLQISA